MKGNQALIAHFCENIDLIVRYFEIIYVILILRFTVLDIFELLFGINIFEY